MKVIKAVKDDIDRAVDLAFSMQSKVESRCRSLALDASRQEIHKLFMDYIERDGHELLLVEKDGKLQGLSPIYWMEEDLYVSYAQGPYAYDYESVSNCLYDYVRDHFKGYTFYVNTAREHLESIKFFEKKNFKLEEDADMLKLVNFTSDYSNTFVEEINDKNSKIVYDWIDKHIDQDTYWNSKRISEHLYRFIILAYFDNGLKGHIIGRCSPKYTEIIAFTGDEVIKEVLLKTFVTKAHERDINFIDLYTEDAYEVELGKKHGFDLYDNNKCFIQYL